MWRRYYTEQLIMCFLDDKLFSDMKAYESHDIFQSSPLKVQRVRFSWKGSMGQKLNTKCFL